VRPLVGGFLGDGRLELDPRQPPGNVSYSTEWDLIREPSRSGPLSLAPVSAKSSKNTRFSRQKRVFYELFFDTDAKERGPDLGGSLTRVQWFRAGLVFEAHTLLYHSAYGAKTY